MDVRIAIVAAFLLAAMPRAQGQEPTKPQDVGSRLHEIGQWELERVTLRNGKAYQGLVAVDEGEVLEFIEICRPQGKPMYLVVRPLPRAEVAAVERLAPEERQRLEARIHDFKNRALIESSHRETIPLESRQLEGTDYVGYQGPWFDLDSTANPEVTRQCIVRLEQMFLAFRQVLPPRPLPAAGQKLRILILATEQQYDRYLRQQQLVIRNPAFFDLRDNLVVAGSATGRIADELAQARQQHKQVLAEHDRQAAQLPREIEKLKTQYLAAGALPANWNRIVAAANKSVADRRERDVRKIAVAERKNAARLQEVVDQMLVRLYHEAFHAYLENYVYPNRQYDVPRWLNEGLAQLFSAGILEGDTLRIDSPSRQMLAELQADLQSDRRLTLERLLSAEPTTFLVPHTSSPVASAQHYLYSWGLTYYLTFHEFSLAPKALDQYVALSSADLPPRTRLEQLVGMPLDKFERQWIAAMLALKPPRRP